MAEAKEKRVRKPRRNFEKELAALKLYCEVSIETLKDIDKQDTAVSQQYIVDGKVAAFERVLAKINGGAA